MWNILFHIWKTNHDLSLSFFHFNFYFVRRCRHLQSAIFQFCLRLHSQTTHVQCACAKTPNWYLLHINRGAHETVKMICLDFVPHSFLSLSSSTFLWAPAISFGWVMIPPCAFTHLHRMQIVFFMFRVQLKLATNSHRTLDVKHSRNIVCSTNMHLIVLFTQFHFHSFGQFVLCVAFLLISSFEPTLLLDE